MCDKPRRERESAKSQTPDRYAEEKTILLYITPLLSYYKKAGVCLSFCLSVTEKFVDLSPSAETGLRRA